jgi:hypothetical protein
MVKLNASDEWYRKIAEDEVGTDVGAGIPALPATTNIPMENGTDDFVCQCNDCGATAMNGEAKDIKHYPTCTPTPTDDAYFNAPMVFSMAHMLDDVTKNEPEEFLEDEPPEWLIGNEFKWFYDKYVLTLEVGKSVETDFHTITRLS